MIVVLIERVFCATQEQQRQQETSMTWGAQTSPTHAIPAGFVDAVL
ncbi:MAG TPA: AsnC family transcriptional regulator, partial [Ochrobactrum sp.]|nr:AsnC family transcriptional regulator [Ochrobactrum sp.]